MRRAQAQTITFPMYDAVSTIGETKSGLALLASDVKISKDGGSVASATNAPAEIGASGRYALLLTASETNCGWFHAYVTQAGARTQDIMGSMSEQPAAAVVSDAGNTPTSFVTDLTSGIVDFWKDALVVFTSGALAGQTKKVTGYNGTTKALTFASGFTSAPAAGSLFLLINI